jgi:tryptophan synthase alpha chain
MNPILPFLMAGDPSLDALPGLLAEAKALGVQALEIGLPHSDPIADGPILQASAQRSIQGGGTPRAVLEALQGLKDSPDLILFTYLNPLLQIGAEALIQKLRGTPVKSLLVVDLPDTEEPGFEADLRTAGYPMIPLLAPTTTLERAAALLAARPDPGAGAPFAQRFAYVVARLGVTGAGLATDLAPVAERVRALSRITSRPLAVGFGLSDPPVLAAVRALGATPVVGSALAKALRDGESLTAFLRPRM